MFRPLQFAALAVAGLVALALLRPAPAAAQGGPEWAPAWRPGTVPPAAAPVDEPWPAVRLAMRASSSAELPAPSPSDAPADLRPWWQRPLRNQFRHNCQAIDVSLDGAVMGALLHSAQVRVLALTPQIRHEAITDQESRFDPQAFVDTRFTNVSDPVGSILTTGGPSRYLDENWYYNSGIKQTTASGASLVASQKIGYEDSNSLYFIPPNQGTSRIDVALTQPLLQGAGRDYNAHGIVLAQIDANIARDQFSKDLQTFLVGLHRDYWDLYLARATLLQAQRLYQEAAGILDELNARRDVDVLQSQIVRARAAVAGREAAVIRAEASVDNAESRVRTALNDSALGGNRPPELIPNQMPDLAYERVDLRAALLAALERRPEINEAAKQLKAASVRAEVSANEMLPVLNLVLGGYVSGLEGTVDIGHAFEDQFTSGRPSYFGGVQFEMPLNNRGPVARNRARELELEQVTSNLEAVTEAVRAEVDSAAREVDTTYRELLSKRQAMAADEAEIRYLTDRWRLLPGDQQYAGVMLNDLLGAQERLAKAEGEFATAEISYTIAQVELRRVTGTLLDEAQVNRAGNIAANLPIFDPAQGGRLPAGNPPNGRSASPASTQPGPMPPSPTGRTTLAPLNPAYFSR